jgi:hypothetical protein
MDIAIEIHDIKNTFYDVFNYINFLNELMAYIDSNNVRYVGCMKDYAFDKDTIYKVVELNNGYDGQYITLHHFNLGCNYPDSHRAEDIKEFLLQIDKTDDLVFIIGFVDDNTWDSEIEYREIAAKDFYKKIKQYVEIPTNIHFHED